MPGSTYYHRPRPESAENLRLLRRLDELYLDCPFFGSRRMAVTLEVNRKRIQRLMRILGIEALYPKPNLSRPAPGHEVYPYLTPENDSREILTQGLMFACSQPTASSRRTEVLLIPRRFAISRFDSSPE